MKKSLDMNKYSKFIIYIVVIILLNIAGITFFFRTDLTENKVYSLSEASREVVGTLSEPLTVKVFFNSNLPAPYNNIERYLHDLMEEYAISGKRRFNYRFHNVSTEDSEESRRNQDLAESYGIQPVQIQNIEHDEVKFQKAYMGIALIHGDIIETLPTVTSTEGLEYQITSAIRKMNNKISALLRIKEKIAVKLFLSSSLRTVGPYMNVAGLANLPSKIERVVKKLNEKNYGKLAFTHIDPSLNPDNENEAGRYKIMQLKWDEFSDRRGTKIAADKGYAGIIIEHGGSFESIELIEVVRLPIFGTQYQLTDLAGLEKMIEGNIENIININEEIGYLADHGALSLAAAPQMFGLQQQESLSSLNTLISDGYSIKPVNLKKDGIPDELSFMIIAGVKENFTDYELYQIDQFLMKGKNLAFFIDSFNEITPQGQAGMMGQQQSYYIPLDTGLERLLAHYGLNINKSIVLDENCFRQKAPRSFGGGERPIYFAPIIKNELINKDARYLKNIKGLVMLKSSPVEVDSRKVKDHRLKAVNLFSSSERSWEMSGRINLDPMSMTPPTDEKEFKSMAMAYMLEGSFPSYFADKPVPEKEEAEGDKGKDSGEKKQAEKKETGMDMSRISSEGITIKEGKPAKIFLIGTSEILKDNVIDEGGKTPNAQFVINVIDYLNGREEIAIMRSKTQRFNPLKKTAPTERTLIKTANIAGLPALVVIAGIAVWAKRASRKRMIQKIFSK